MKRPLAVLFGLILVLLIVICVTPSPRSARAVGTNTEDYVDQISNLHAPADIGTHSAFANQQAKDGVADVLTEGNVPGSESVFGYSGSGASFVQPQTNYLWGSMFTSPSAIGQITDGHMYGRAESGSANVKFVIVAHSTMQILFVSSPTSMSTTVQWYTFSWTTAPTLSPSTEYVLMGIGSAAWRFYYTTADYTDQCHTDNTNDYPVPLDPTDATHVTRKDRIYIHYAPPNYRLDLEEGWTAADYDEDNEELCVYPTSIGAETLGVDVWSGAAWVNIIASLVVNQWNNASVAAYLTSAAFEIRFIDGTQTSDGTATQWSIDAVLLHVWSANHAPVNVSAVCTDPDDGDNLYARYKEYVFVTSSSDADGATDIDLVWLGLAHGAGPSMWWTVAFDGVTNTFSEAAGAAAIELNLVTSSYVKSGIWLNITWRITIEWAHTDESDDDLRLDTRDLSNVVDQDYYDLNYDVETRLDLSTYNVADAVGTTDRGSLDGALTASGTVVYYGSALTPPSAEVDVWVSCTDVATSPWSDTTLSAGQFSLTVYADDVVGLDTYTCIVVQEAAGSGGADECHATHTDTYIADRVTVTLSITYSKLGLGQNCSGLLKSGTYQYDSAAFDGSITLNSTTFSYATPGYRGYTTISISGDTHGVTVFSTNSLTVLWQNVTVTWSHFWTRYSEFLWFAHIDVVTMQWSIEGTTLPTGVTVLFYENGSIFTTDTVSSGAVEAVHDYGTGWNTVVWTLKLTYVSAPYNVTTLLFYTHAPEVVPVVHTIYPEFYLAWTDLYLYITWFTNWHNASIYVWSNVTTLWGYSYYEGVTQLVLPTTIALYMVDILINGSSPHSGTNDGTYPADDAWHWYHFNFTISVSAFTTFWMTFKDAGGHVILWGTFIVYVDDYECPQSWVMVSASSTVNVTVTDDFGQIVYQDLAYPTGAGTNTMLRETLVVYTLTLTNQRYYAQSIVVSRNSYDSPKLHVSGYGSVPWLVYGSAAGIDYRVQWYNKAGTVTDNDTWTVYLADQAIYSGYEEQPIDVTDLNLNLPNFAFAMQLMAVAMLLGFLGVGVVAFVAGRGRRAKSAAFIGLAPDTPGAPREPRTPSEVAQQAGPRAREAGAAAREEGRRIREEEARRNRGQPQ